MLLQKLLTLPINEIKYYLGGVMVCDAESQDTETQRCYNCSSNLNCPKINTSTACSCDLAIPRELNKLKIKYLAYV